MCVCVFLCLLIWYFADWKERDEKREEIEVSGIDDVVLILNSDYENAYFVTGTFLHSKIFCVLMGGLKNEIIN